MRLVSTSRRASQLIPNLPIRHRRLRNGAAAQLRHPHFEQHIHPVCAHHFIRAYSFRILLP